MLHRFRFRSLELRSILSVGVSLLVGGCIICACNSAGLILMNVAMHLSGTWCRCAGRVSAVFARWRGFQIRLVCRFWARRHGWGSCLRGMLSLCTTGKLCKHVLCSVLPGYLGILCRFKWRGIYSLIDTSGTSRPRNLPSSWQSIACTVDLPDFLASFCSPA